MSENVQDKQIQEELLPWNIVYLKVWPQSSRPRIRTTRLPPLFHAQLSPTTTSIHIWMRWQEGRWHYLPQQSIRLAPFKHYISESLTDFPISLVQILHYNFLKRLLGHTVISVFLWHKNGGLPIGFCRIHLSVIVN